MRHTLDRIVLVAHATAIVVSLLLDLARKA
jgi:hypothetical protein